MEMVAYIQDRQLTLRRGTQSWFTLPLDSGGRYRLIAADAEETAEMLQALEKIPSVGVLTQDGGLLGTMTVAENWATALSYGMDANEICLSDLGHKIELAMQLSGISPERVQIMAGQKPEQLTPSECFLVGLVRSIVKPPQLLILDQVFTGLSRKQIDARIALESIFHDFHPFKPTLFVELDAHTQTTIPHCHDFPEMSVLACPS
jgi:ABC-type ATPase involved in cell division